MDRSEIQRIAWEEMGCRVEHSSREPGWIYFHGLRTAKLALWLADELRANVDHDLLYIAGLFHDVGKGKRSHNEVGALRARELLADSCLPAELIQIEEMIVGHCLRGQPGQSLPVHILQDADILDHIGPIGPWLAYYWSGSKGESFAEHVRFYQSEDIRHTRQKMYAQLNFEPSRMEYIRRIRWEDEVMQTLHAAYEEGVWTSRPGAEAAALWSPDVIDPVSGSEGGQES